MRHLVRRATNSSLRFETQRESLSKARVNLWGEGRHDNDGARDCLGELLAIEVGNASILYLGGSMGAHVETPAPTIFVPRFVLTVVVVPDAGL